MTRVATPDELIDLLSEAGKAGQKIREQLADARVPVYLLVVEEHSEHRLRAQQEILRLLAPKHETAVIVSLNHPIDTVARELKAAGLDADKYYYIDAITRTGEGQEREGKNFAYLDNAKDLVEITVAIDRFREAAGGPVLVYLDSLTTLLIFHDPLVLEKFVHALIAKLRGAGDSGVFLLGAHANARVLDAVSEFCDRVLRI